MRAEERIVVPEGGLKAAEDASKEYLRNNQSQKVHAHVVVEAFCQWQSENPPVPTEKQWARCVETEGCSPLSAWISQMYLLDSSNPKESEERVTIRKRPDWDKQWQVLLDNVIQVETFEERNAQIYAAGLRAKLVENSSLKEQLATAQSTIEALAVEIRTLRYALNPNTLERMIQHGEVPVGDGVLRWVSKDSSLGLDRLLSNIAVGNEKLASGVAEEILIALRNKQNAPIFPPILTENVEAAR
jgi:hypothetical protein